jgi:metallophosphoesterase (TIGR00282 family)
MRLLFLGDIVGRPGRNAVIERLPGLRDRWQLDCVVINGENSAGGFGITEAICDEILGAGADAITLGNHSWDQRETLVFIERQPRLLRPANYPPGTPGRGANLIDTRSGQRVLVVQVMGRLYMDPLDDPFAAVDRELETCPLGQVADAIIVDVHAEATSEKEAMGHHLDGRASLVVGTHTHVPTADHRVRRRRGPAWSRAWARALSPASPSRRTTALASPGAWRRFGSGPIWRKPGRVFGTDCGFSVPAVPLFEARRLSRWDHRYKAGDDVTEVSRARLPAPFTSCNFVPIFAARRTRWTPR